MLELNESNYFSVEANTEYCSVSQLKQFIGFKGEPPCESKALAIMRGEYVEKPSTALLLGSYVECALLEPNKLDAFKDAHPEMFSSRGNTKGSLKAEFLKGDRMVERAKQDPFFMKTLVGEHQKIMTGEIYGVPFKIKIDVYREGKYLTDLKTVQSIGESYYNTILSRRQSFVEYFDYISQATIYTEIVRQRTGLILPFFLSCVSKEEEPDLEVIQIDYDTQQERLLELEEPIVNIGKLKRGEVVPIHCGGCAWCRKNKVLTRPISWLELGGELN